MGTARISVSSSASHLPCAVEGATRRAVGTRALPLQFRASPQVSEAWASNGNPGDASRAHEEAAHLQRDLLFSKPSFIIGGIRSCVYRLHSERETRGVKTTGDDG